MLKHHLGCSFLSFIYFFYRRNSIANGLPSKATLCHVLQSIDDEKMTNRMSAFAEVFPQGNYGGTISFLFHFL
ncbi:hypothetical protein E5339_21000 [Phocaeicola sartorii]|uniref:Uncharacterized protein n=1 Tax=Phocaeicola sartorii TaxID=671267 RepID=A0A4S2FC83_9BACT|nr:hypothetical protein E5339_21000 [Phocaeicola sartorii]